MESIRLLPCRCCRRRMWSHTRTSVNFGRRLATTGAVHSGVSCLLARPKCLRISLSSRDHMELLRGSWPASPSPLPSDFDESLRKELRRRTCRCRASVSVLWIPAGRPALRNIERGKSHRHRGGSGSHRRGVGSCRARLRRLNALVWRRGHDRQSRFDIGRRRGPFHGRGPGSVSCHTSSGARGGDNYISDLVSAGIDGQPCSRAAYDNFSVSGVYIPATTVFALSVTAWLLRRRLSTPNLPRLRNAVPYLSLSLALIATVAFSFVPPLNPANQLPSWALHLLIWLTALFATLVSILMVAQPEPITNLASEDDPSTDPAPLGDRTTTPA
jgi:hypothetical protein